MESRRSNISANAEYMNDAILSAMSNFRKASKRKQSHIWATGINLPDDEVFERRSEAEQVLQTGVRTPSTRNGSGLSRISKIPYKIANATVYNHPPSYKAEMESAKQSRHSAPTGNTAAEEVPGGIWGICPEQTNITNDDVKHNRQSTLVATGSTVGEEFKGGIRDTNPGDIQSKIVDVKRNLQSALVTNVHTAAGGFPGRMRDISPGQMQTKVIGQTPNLQCITAETGKLVNEVKRELSNVKDQTVLEQTRKTVLPQKQTCTTLASSAALFSDSKRKLEYVNKDHALQSTTRESVPDKKSLRSTASEEETNLIKTQRKSNCAGVNYSTEKRENKNPTIKKIKGTYGSNNNIKCMDKAEVHERGTNQTTINVELQTGRRNITKEQYRHTQIRKVMTHKNVELHSSSQNVYDVPRRSYPPENWETSTGSRNAELNPGEFEHSVIRIKVVKDERYREFLTNPSDLLRIKTKLPKLLEVIPSIDAKHKEVNYSADAVSIIMKYLFDPPYDFHPSPNGRTVVEALAASHTWDITDLRRKLQVRFRDKILDETNMNELYSIASHLGDRELCDDIENSGKAGGPIKKNAARYRQRTCFVYCQTYAEPLEFPIPLTCSGETAYDDNFSKDIRNDITFEAVSGCFAITGFQLSFVVESGEDVDPTKVKIYYQLSNAAESSSVADQKVKPLRSTMIVHFREDFVVKQGQKCEISVETEAKPYSCYVSEEEDLSYKSPNGDCFKLALTSTFRLKNTKKPRFFIEKLFFRKTANSA